MLRDLVVNIIVNIYDNSSGEYIIVFIYAKIIVNIYDNSNIA